MARAFGSPCMIFVCIAVTFWICAVEASSRIFFMLTWSCTSITSNAPFRRWSIELSFADNSWFCCFYASEIFGSKQMYSSQSAERNLSFSSLSVKNSIVLIFLIKFSSLKCSLWFALIEFSMISSSASLSCASYPNAARIEFFRYWSAYFEISYRIWYLERPKFLINLSNNWRSGSLPVSSHSNYAEIIYFSNSIGKSVCIW